MRKNGKGVKNSSNKNNDTGFLIIENMVYSKENYENHKGQSIARLRNHRGIWLCEYQLQICWQNVRMQNELTGPRTSGEQSMC